MAKQATAAIQHGGTLLPAVEIVSYNAELKDDEKPVGEPDAGNPHVRFDERGWETERCRTAQATAPILDFTLG